MDEIKINMTKNLRIIIIAMAGFVAVFYGALMFFDIGKDVDIENFLAKETVVEKFKKENKKTDKSNKDQVFPLVKQAMSFALYLDPPPPPEKKVPAGEKAKAKKNKKIPKQPPAVSSKFKLVATAVGTSPLSQSWALISEDGAGLKWVKQGSTVGHAVIEKVTEGAIAVKDGSRKYELTVKPIKRVNLVKNASDKSSQSTNQPKTDAKSKSSAKSLKKGLFNILKIGSNKKANTDKTLKKNKTVPNKPANNIVIDLEAQRQQRELEKMTEEQRKQWIDKIFAELEAELKMKSKEAQQTGDLGEKLKKQQPADPNKSANSENSDDSKNDSNDTK